MHPTFRLTLMAYVDSDYGEDKDSRKSVTGYVILIAGCPVAYRSQRQKSISLSSVEAEFIALSEVIRELQWWRQLLSELGIPFEKPVIVFCDNTGAISNMKGPRKHERTKHIDIRYKYSRAAVESGEVDVQYVESERNIADLFTKVQKDKNTHS